MPQTFNTWDASLVLQPAQAPGDARQDAIVLAPSATYAFGDVLAIKDSDALAYKADTASTVPSMNKGIGLMMMSGITDASSNFYPGSGVNATPDLIQGGWKTAPYFKSGIFDRADLKMGGSAISAANLVLLFSGFVRKLGNGFYNIFGQ